MADNDNNQRQDDLLSRYIDQCMDSVESALDKDWPEWKEKAKENWESMQQRDARLRKEGRLL